MFYVCLPKICEFIKRKTFVLSFQNKLDDIYNIDFMSKNTRH